jgi:hypothetical protein
MLRSSGKTSLPGAGDSLYLSSEKMIPLADRFLTADREHGCLVCLESGKPSAAIEHIVPEGLGNAQLVLPAGVVCDDCNHGVCSDLDDHLIRSPVVELMRIMRAIRGKEGRSPAPGKYGNGFLYMLEPEAGENPRLILNLDARRQSRKTANGFEFDLERRGIGELHWSLVSRALLKIALELVYLDHGRRALSVEFDRVRRIVREGGHDGVVLIPPPNLADARVGPEYTIRTVPSQRWSHLFAWLHFYGLTLFTHTDGLQVSTADQHHDLFGFGTDPHNKQSDYFKMTVGIEVRGESETLDPDDPSVFDPSDYRR